MELINQEPYLCTQYNIITTYSVWSIQYGVCNRASAREFCLLIMKHDDMVIFYVYCFCAFASFLLMLQHNHIRRICMVFHQCVLVNVV